MCRVSHRKNRMVKAVALFLNPASMPQRHQAHPHLLTRLCVIYLTGPLLMQASSLAQLLLIGREGLSMSSPATDQEGSVQYRAMYSLLTTLDSCLIS